MTALYPNKVADAVKFVLEQCITRNEIIDLSMKLQNLSVAKDLASPNYYDKGETSFTYNLQPLSYSNIQTDTLFKPDSYTTGNLGVKGSSYWAMQKSGMAFDVRMSGYGSKSPNALVDMVKMHYRNMWVDYLTKQEEYKWGLATGPNDGTAGDIVPNGIKNYVVQSSTATVGQNGGNPSGYSSGMDGLNRTTYPQLKNWTATAASIDEMLQKMSEMFDKMMWVPPKPQGGEKIPERRYMVASHYFWFQQYQNFLTNANDNLGSDAGKYRGPIQDNVLKFRGVDWEWVPALTNSTYRDTTSTSNPVADATNKPVYMLDESTWEIAAARNWFEVLHAPMVQDNPHNTVAIPFDTIYQRVCLNPSANGVLIAA